MKWGVLAAVALAAAACRPLDVDLRRAGAPPSARAAAAEQAQIELGRKVYNYRCYFCHGYSGDARTLAATYMTPSPRDFTRADAQIMSTAHIAGVVRRGVPGTGMKPFLGILSPRETLAVAAFVRDEFVLRRAPNTRYHTAENGWPNHERYAAAFPFARGEIPLDRPWSELTETQAAGKRMFLSSCVSCHDRAHVEDEGPAWSAMALSYPRVGYDHRDPPAPPVDAMSTASVYAKHDVVPQIAGLTPGEKRGEALYQGNCAFCHGADGTGKNWIGRFLEPHPRDLTDPAFMAGMDRARLRQVIREGLPNTSMPAWQHVLQPDEIEAIMDYVGRAFHPLAPAPAAAR